MHKYWNIKNAAEGVGEIFLYGDISDMEWWGDEVTPKQIDNELKNLGKLDVLNIYINSGGGSFFAGMAIYNIIKRADATTKNAFIDGLAASISSVIPLSCDKVFMPSNTLMMIHLPAGGVYGNVNDLSKMIGILDKCTETIVDIYSQKTGLDNKKLLKMMNNETWLTAKEAIELGFADELQENINVSTSLNEKYIIFNEQKFDINRYKNTEFLNKFDGFVNKNINITAQVDDFLEQSKSFNDLRKKLIGGI